jgi:hypothetical protein
MRSLALVTLLVLGVAVPARAGFTTPDLVLASASGAEVSGVRTVAVTGAFDFPNTVQADYALEVVVFQGTRFARYPVTGAAVAGDSAALADGTLAAGELSAFLHDGAAADAEVRILSITAGGIRVRLPAAFTAGSATALLFAVLNDGNVFSNAILFQLP